jgi:lipopolysaccharide export LptBFGC system permease protein LptF
LSDFTNISLSLNRLRKIQKKYSIGILLTAMYVVIILAIPPLIFEESVTPIIAGITVIMVAIYVLLGLDVIH